MSAISRCVESVREIEYVVGGSFEIAYEIYKHAARLRLACAFVKASDMPVDDMLFETVDFVFYLFRANRRSNVYFIECPHAFVEKQVSG